MDFIAYKWQAITAYIKAAYLPPWGMTKCMVKNLSLVSKYWQWVLGKH